MADLHVGDQRTLRATFRGEDDIPTNPTEVWVSLRAPDGSVASYAPPTVGNPSVGTYTYEWLPDQPGNWNVWWEGIGAVQEAGGERHYVAPRLVERATP